MANWIQKAIPPSSRGGLHRSLGMPEGKRIPRAEILQAAKAGGKIGKQARLALTLEGMHGAKKLKKPMPKRIKR